MQYLARLIQGPTLNMRPHPTLSESQHLFTTALNINQMRQHHRPSHPILVETENLTSLNDLLIPFNLHVLHWELQLFEDLPQPQRNQVGTVHLRKRGTGKGHKQKGLPGPQSVPIRAQN